MICRKLQVGVLAVALFGQPWSGSVAAGDPARPNFIVIFCDNLGYGDVGCYNPGTKNRTPRVDRMAAEGVRFTDCYAAAPVCTPSRAAMMTGCYPRRVGLDRTEPDNHVLRPVSGNGLNPDEVTVAEVLKGRGYATACIGKWHLGDQPPFLPTRQGFDYYLGIPYSDDMTARESQPTWPPLPLMEGETVIEAPVDRSGLTQRYTEAAIRFIEGHRGEPFYIYLPHATPGSTKAPFVGEAFRGKSANGPWGDSVEELDWSTGQILDALVRLKLDKDTLVIWTNDNGAPPGRGASNAPLKGDAYSVAEGGMRVPFIAWWPGRVRAGSVCREVCTLMDVYPTLAGLAGAGVPGDRVIDGRDIRALMFDEPGAKSPHEAFYYYYVDQLQAVRSGRWKLYLPLETKQGGFGKKASSSSSAELYDLVADLGEKRNLADVEAGVVKRLLALADRAREDLGEAELRGPRVRPVGRFENPTPRVMGAVGER